MSATTTTHLRTALILLIAVLAFVTTYQVAEAADRGAQNAGEPAVFPGGDRSTPACACYGNSGIGETTEGAATVEGNVRRISVDATNGYDPDVIRLTAGVPAEITFSQASGCMAQVMSDDLDFYADLTGGPQTVHIEAAALQPGEYSFSCGMQMVFGTIIVE
jgi:hypothetical protein